MELIYELEEPLVGTTRVYKASEKKALLLENSAICPSCSINNNILNQKDLINDIEMSLEKSNLEIAHIYGLKNFSGVKHEGNLFHIKDSSHLNSYDNLILLCHACHQNYDNPPTYEKYIDLVKMKNDISKDFKNSNYIYRQFYFSLDEIKDVCDKVKLNEDNDFNAEKFLEKLKINEIDVINTHHYENYLVNYAISIDEFFVEFDEEGRKLLQCFSKIYNELKKEIKDKNIILREISKSKIIEQLSKTMNALVFNALIAYMIWKCEVLDKYDSPEQNNKN